MTIKQGSTVSNVLLEGMHLLLFQEHFEPDQFESHRADGKRKLTPCAVPTLFCHLEKAKRRTLPARTLPARTKSSKPTASEHAYCARSRKKVLLRQTDEIDSDSNIFAKQVRYSLRHELLVYCIISK